MIVNNLPSGGAENYNALDSALDTTEELEEGLANAVGAYSTHSVTTSLDNHVTLSNPAQTVEDCASYAASLTADIGELYDVHIYLGDTPVTGSVITRVSDSQYSINIPCVYDDIYIEAGAM